MLSGQLHAVDNSMHFLALNGVVLSGDYSRFALAEPYADMLIFLLI